VSKETAQANRRTLTQSADGLTEYVDGVPVIASEPVTVDVNDMSVPPVLRGQTLGAVHVLLLEDESPAFRCMHSERGDCNFVARFIQSVTAHQRSHGKMQTRRLRAEVDAMKTAKATRAANHSAAAHGVAQKRATLIDQFKDEDGNVDLAKLGERVVIMLNARDEAEKEFIFALRIFLREVEKATMRTIGKSTQHIDPSVLEAAQKWNTVKDLFTTK
jgi:hypothetical protein